MVQFREVGPLGVGLLAYLEADVRTWIENRPTLHRLLPWFTTLALFVVLLAASGCGGGSGDQDASGGGSVARSGASLDRAGKLACDKFARWLAGDEKPATRPTIGVQVNDLAADSDSGAIADKAELLIKPGVYDSNENWALAADSLAYECQVQGWKP